MPRYSVSLMPRRDMWALFMMPIEPYHSGVFIGLLCCHPVKEAELP